MLHHYLPIPYEYRPLLGCPFLNLRLDRKIVRPCYLADFSFALRKTYELLKEPAGQKGIWLITDMALTGWDRLAVS